MRFLVTILLMAASCRAEIVDSSANGFIVRTVLDVKANPDEVYNKFIHNIGDWWDPEHTFSRDAKNLRMEDRPGGCFCEKLPNNGFVRHLEVIYLAPGEEVILSGGIGPMQSLAATGSMVVKFAPAAGGTKLEMTYSVSGYLPKGMNTWAPPLDKVTAAQFTRLKNYVETGKAELK